MTSRATGSPFLTLARCLCAAGLLAGVLITRPARAEAPASTELDQMLSKLPDPAKWKESPLQAALDPATHDPDLARVEAALRAKNFAGALRLMQTIAARYPHHPAIQYTYGKLALLLHSYTQAEHAFLAVAAIPKAAALGWYFAGATQFLENRPRDAVASMRRCIQAKPPTILAAYAWTAMGYYETLSGRAGDAVQAAQQGTRLAPTNGFIWAMRGFCDAGAHRFDTAIADYRRAIALNHRLAIAYEGLGSTYAQLDHPGDAIAPLKAALALAPGNYLAATQLGYCYLRCGQPADGAKACRQAITARPGFSKAWDVLGLCYRQLGKHRDALAAFRQAVRTGPDDAGARAHLDQAAREAGTRT